MRRSLGFLHVYGWKNRPNKSIYVFIDRKTLAGMTIFLFSSSLGLNDVSVKNVYLLNFKGNLSAISCAQPQAA